jgi:hypothetical protein
VLVADEHAALVVIVGVSSASVTHSPRSIFTSGEIAPASSVERVSASSRSVRTITGSWKVSARLNASADVW